MQFIDASHISQSPLVNLMAFVAICEKRVVCRCGCMQWEWMQKSRRWQVWFELERKLQCLIGVLPDLWKWSIGCFWIQRPLCSLIFSALRLEKRGFYMLVDIIHYNTQAQNGKSVKLVFLNRTCERRFNARNVQMTNNWGMMINTDTWIGCFLWGLV